MNMYLINKEDYIRHINDKVQLYTLLKFLTNQVAQLPSNRGNKNLSIMASQFAEASDAMFDAWDIPVEYLVFREEEDLADLMESELFDPADLESLDSEPNACEYCGACHTATNESVDCDTVAEVINAIHAIAQFLQH